MGMYKIESLFSRYYEAPLTWMASGKKEKSNEIVFCLEGEALFTVEDEVYVVRPYQLLLLPDGRHFSHKLTSKRKFTYYQCHFFGEISDKPIFDFLGLSDSNLLVTADNPAELIPRFEGYVNDTRFPDAASLELMQTANTMEIIKNYVRLRKKEMPGKNAEEFAEVIDFMKQNLNAPITTGDLSMLMHMQPSYFTRCFSSAFKLPPMKYFDKMRCGYAAKQLHSTSLSEEEIAFSIGMENKYYFRKFFEKYYKMSPEEYRDLLK